MRLLALMLLLVTVAGCLDNDDVPEPEPAEEPVDLTPRASGRIPVAPDPSVFLGTVANSHATGQPDHVGHQIGALHDGSHNLRLLDHNTLQDGLLQPAGGFTELHVVNDTAVVTSLTSTRGATLVDLSLIHI